MTCSHPDDHLTIQERTILCQDCGQRWLAVPPKARSDAGGSSDYERGYQDGESSVTADVEFFISEVLELEQIDGESWADTLRREFDAMRVALRAQA